MIKKLLKEYRGLKGEEKFAVITLGSVALLGFILYLGLWFWVPVAALIITLVAVCSAVLIAVVAAIDILSGGYW
jgi:hypothetical protein